MREPGWYWVKYAGAWQCAYHEHGAWCLVGLDADLETERLREIGSRILTPVEMAAVKKKMVGLEEAARLAERFANAKDRYHSQQAMCDLLEHFGKPCARPGEPNANTN